MHYCHADMITAGEVKFIGINGTVAPSGYNASSVFVPEERLTALELAKLIEKRLKIRHLRISCSSAPMVLPVSRKQ